MLSREHINWKLISIAPKSISRMAVIFHLHCRKIFDPLIWERMWSNHWIPMWSDMISLIRHDRISVSLSLSGQSRIYDVKARRCCGGKKRSLKISQLDCGVSLSDPAFTSHRSENDIRYIQNLIIQNLHFPYHSTKLISCLSSPLFNHHPYLTVRLFEVSSKTHIDHSRRKLDYFRLLMRIGF